jgi:energy-coupling factor transporter ATP-binding protein EcfA2
LTQTGRDWALESQAQSQYFGPAPVTLEAYHDRVVRQRVTNEWRDRAAVQDAFKAMVLPDRFINRLGPSINSGTAMLLYGPAGNGKTTVAETIGGIFDTAVYIPYCFEVDGHIIKVFDPSIHKPMLESAPNDSRRRTERPERGDQRWVRCHRPCVITGGELTLDMLDLQFSERSRFYEAPLHIKALNGVFVIDDFGRQRAAPADILNRWILPLNNRVDYLSLHTGKNFQVPFDELVIFSTNLHPKELMDAAFLRRIDYKLRADEPTEPLFRQVFEDVCRTEGLEFDPKIYKHVVNAIHAYGAPLAYYQAGFIARQVLASCKFLGTKPQFTEEIVDDAMLNLFVQAENSPDDR